MTLWDEVSKCYGMVFLASGGLGSEKGHQEYIQCLSRASRFVLCACDLHMKRGQSLNRPENSGGCQYLPLVSRKLSAGILTNWLN